jgi:hypothetical protein
MRSRQVELTLANAGGLWLPGAYVEARIELAGNAKPLPVVPANTLVMDQHGARVVIVDDEQRIHFRVVALGRDFGREVEIAEGVGLNDRLVASPSDLLAEGETVRAVAAQSAATRRSQ